MMSPKKGNINQIYLVIRFSSLTITMLTFTEYHEQARYSIATGKMTFYPFQCEPEKFMFICMIKLKVVPLSKKATGFYIFAGDLAFLGALNQGTVSERLCPHI